MQCLTGLVLLLTLTVSRRTEAAGSGRALPIRTENYIIDRFRSINPTLEWDKTNFLIDLSGYYANCDNLNVNGFITVDKQSLELQGLYVPVEHIETGIQAIVDSAPGVEHHVRAVDEYLRPMIDRWIVTTRPNDFRGRIQAARKFGCSVRPGCSDKVVLACLFSPGQSPPPPPRPPPLPATSTTTTQRPNCFDNCPPAPCTKPFDRTVDVYGLCCPICADQRARAFTKQQYSLAERISDQTWDGTHYLENLSGYETRCQMIGKQDSEIKFDVATNISRYIYGRDVFGLFGSAPNEGNTEDAMTEILEKIVAAANQKYKVKRCGCSLIADCPSPYGRFDPYDKYVVIACIEECPDRDRCFQMGSECPDKCKKKYGL